MGLSVFCFQCLAVLPCDAGSASSVCSQKHSFGPLATHPPGKPSVENPLISGQQAYKTSIKPLKNPIKPPLSALVLPGFAQGFFSFGHA